MGKLCEQNKMVREQDRLVQQLRAEKVRSGWLVGRVGKGPEGDRWEVGSCGSC